MSVAHSTALQTFELHQGVTPTLDGLCGGLLDLSSLQQASLNVSYATASDLGNLGSSGSALGLSAADLLRAHHQQPLHSQDALQQLTALQQQQQLAQALAAEPLISLSNLLAAQQGLSARVQELLLLKQQLQQVVPARPSGGGGIRGTGPINNTLYKTELCRSWEETGSCRYGAKCQFAHGREELRPVVRHPKYKTEVCRTFAQSGTCPYGTRCRFIHSTTPAPHLPTPPATGTVVSGCASGTHTGTTTPTAGASTPRLCGSREPSFSSLHGLGSAPTPASSLPGYAPSSPMPSIGGLLSGFGAPAPTMVNSAGLLGLQSGNAFGPAGPFPGYSAAFPTAAAAPTSNGSCGSVGCYTAAAPGSGCGGDASSATMLAALSALLGTAPAATAPLPLNAASLTTAAAATGSTLGFGVVGTPAGLPAIGVGHGLSPSAQQLPSCPATPVGTCASGVVNAMRRSISDSDASTPGGSTKRLPIFEQLIPEDDGATNPAATATKGTATDA